MYCHQWEGAPTSQKVCLNVDTNKHKFVQEYNRQKWGVNPNMTYLINFLVHRLFSLRQITGPLVSSDKLSSRFTLQMSEVTSELESIFSTAQYCPTSGNCLDLEPGQYFREFPETASIPVLMSPNF